MMNMFLVVQLSNYTAESGKTMKSNRSFGRNCLKQSAQSGSAFSQDSHSLVFFSHDHRQLIRID